MVTLGASPVPMHTAPERPRRGRRQACIQSFGFLLLVEASSLKILQASANAATMLGVEHVLGRSLDALGGDLADAIRHHAQDPPTEIARVLRCRAGAATEEFAVLFHGSAQGELLLELEPVGESLASRVDLQQCLQSIVEALDPTQLEEATARVFKEVTGYDRVLVFRLDAEGHGEVVAERRESDIASCLGQSFADVEIPFGAHALILRNRIRHLADAEAPPVPIEPGISPLSGRELDLSACACRAMSSRHLRFLKQMGVRASLVVAILVRGRPWGLIVCHHRAPRFLQYERRAVCELLAETVATRILALERLTRVQVEQRVRELEARMIESISREGDWTSALTDHPPALLEPLSATGAALAHEGKWLTLGQVPGPAPLAEIVAWLDAQPCDGVIATASLGRREPRLGELAELACGLLAVPVSNLGGEYLIWFRSESPSGEPLSEMSGDAGAAFGAFPLLLSAAEDRRGLVWARGRSRQWTASDRMAARLFGASIGDVIQQFRSVRILIAQAQLAQARSRAGMSDQLILIADAEGRILLATQAWGALLGPGRQPPESLADVIELCAEPMLAEYRIGELLRERRSWRGSLGLRLDEADLGSFMARADPVFASPGCLLGFILILDPLGGQGAGAPDAQGRFEEMPHRRCGQSQGMSPAGRGTVYERLLPTLLDHAARAERVADAGDPSLAPATSDALHSSVARTVDLLERLIWYANQSIRQERGHLS